MEIIIDFRSTSANAGALPLITLQRVDIHPEPPLESAPKEGEKS